LTTIQVNDTKLKLIDSLNSLQISKHFCNITVKDIAYHAGISRQAFYLYFKDKYDLLNWSFTLKSDEIVRAYIDSCPWHTVLAQLMETHKKEGIYTKSLVEYAGQNSLAKYMEEYTFNTYYKVLREKYRLSEEKLKDEMFSLKLYSCGSAKMTVSWVFAGMKEPADQIAKHLVKSMNLNFIQYFE